ncbi:MAG: type II secretion system protein [Planctomycetota bacterium]|jgi:prepilin-type processing-associated H-X9-DG protein
MHHLRSHGDHRGFSLLEAVVSLGIIVVLLSILIPALSSARAISHLETCSGHQRHLWSVCGAYLEDHDEAFPFVGVQAGWHYGGVRFSAVDGKPFADPQRPLNPYLRTIQSSRGALEIFRCPADRGITHPDAAVGTGRRTAIQSFGTSFRANAALFDTRLAGIEGEPRGLRRAEITTPPSRLLVLGDPVWYEVFHETGRDAAWHREPDSGNMLFLDGSVRFEQIRPGTTNQPVVFDPVYRTERESPTTH